MRSLLLLIGLLAVPVAFISPADAQTGPPCCQPEDETTHPPDPHNRGPIFVPAEVTRRDERALAAGAEAPVNEETPLANAVALPTDELRVVVPIAREPIIAADQTAPDFDIDLSPCCRVIGETKPPHPHSEQPPLVLVGAEVTKRDERALEAAVELPIPVEIPLVNAIGIPLEAPRGVSEPAYRPTPIEATGPWLTRLDGRAALVVLAILLSLAIFLHRWTRRRPERLEDRPSPKRPRYPFELLHPDVTRAPSFESVSSPGKISELEPV